MFKGALTPREPDLLASPTALGKQDPLQVAVDTVKQDKPTEERYTQWEEVAPHITLGREVSDAMYLDENSPGLLK